tara:strand:+ start:5334 stop:5513 length:180 start_codon:yes stop_codon:yes gene_type:complete
MENRVINVDTLLTDPSTCSIGSNEYKKFQLETYPDKNYAFLKWAEDVTKRCNEVKFVPK